MSIDDLKRWLTDYKAAWENRDPDAASRLFTEDALYHETPYADPFRGPEGVKGYWANVTADQRNVSFESEPLGILGGNTGVAKWRATFDLDSSGASMELNGIFVLEFDEQGKLCKSLREWWHAR